MCMIRRETMIQQKHIDRIKEGEVREEIHKRLEAIGL